MDPFWRSWATFGLIFWCLYFECSPKGVLEAPELDFDSILRGLGGVWEDFGRVLGEFGGSTIVVFLDRVF